MILKGITIILVPVLIIFLALEMNSIYGGKEDEEIHVNHDGTILTEDEFHQKSVYCQKMKLEGLIEPVNCHKWVLTAEGDEKILDYILEINGIDTSEEKLDFLLNQLD